MISTDFRLLLSWFIPLAGLTVVPTEVDAQKPAPSAQEHPASTAAPASLPGPPVSAKYLQDAKHWGKEFIYKGWSEPRVYADIGRRNMHYAYVAFLQLFPKSPQHAEVARQLEQFALVQFPAGGKTLVTNEELKQKYNWNGALQIYRWNNAFTSVVRPAGIAVLSLDAVSPATAISVKTLITEDETPYVSSANCLGNLQIVSGLYAVRRNGIEFGPGTSVIYPLLGSRSK